MNSPQQTALKRRSLLRWRHRGPCGSAPVPGNRHRICDVHAQGGRQAGMADAPLVLSRRRHGDRLRMVPRGDGRHRRRHPRATVVVDEASASALQFADHYRWIDANKLPWQRYD